MAHGHPREAKVWGERNHQQLRSHGNSFALSDPFPLARRETEEVKEQFKGLTFKILFTVPVHSSTEKEFIVRTSLFSKTALVKMKK